MRFGQVAHLAAIRLEVVELPDVRLEMPPTGGRRRVHRIGMPALGPDAAGPEHGIELGVLRGGRIRAHQDRLEADALDGALGVALHLARRIQAQEVVKRGDEVDRVKVLVPHLAPGRDPLGPGEQHGIRGPALVARVAFEKLERRVEGQGPTGGIVIVGGRSAEVVEVLEVLAQGVGNAVEELVLVDRAVRAPLSAGSVIRDDHDHRVGELIGFLQEVEKATDLRVGIAHEARVDLRHADEEALLIL
ncbi:hypothetical protein D3C86_1276950 [compost metagenome]